MDVILEQVKGALIDLDAGIKGADNTKMLASMERLDHLVTAHRASLDARLAHFLDRRSYAKALEFLGGASDVPRGSCAPQ